jgi:hypothetical protein
VLSDEMRPVNHLGHSVTCCDVWGIIPCRSHFFFFRLVRLSFFLECLVCSELILAFTPPICPSTCGCCFNFGTFTTCDAVPGFCDCNYGYCSSAAGGVGSCDTYAAAQDYVFTATVDTILSVPAASGLLSTVSCVGSNPGPLQLFLESVPTTMGGSVDIATDGSFVYNPAAGYSGSDSFQYQLVLGEECGCKRNAHDETNVKRQVPPPPAIGTVTLSVNAPSGFVSE